jgi:hypothetical protein
MQARRINGVLHDCPICGGRLLLDNDDELVALDLPLDEPEQVSETTSPYRSGIRTVEAAEGWNKYLDPTHVKTKPALQPFTGKAHPEYSPEVSKPIVVEEDEGISEIAKQDLVRRGISPHQSQMNPASSPRFKLKLEIARAFWADKLNQPTNQS